MSANKVLVLIAVVLFGMTSSARSGIATFDSLDEGSASATFMDGGITFFDPDNYVNDDTDVFVIEQADGTLGGPFFSPPNALTMNGAAPGPEASFSRMGSFWATTGSVQDMVSIDLFLFVDALIENNTITLEAFLDKTSVGSHSFTMTSFGTFHRTLSISGVEFDTVRLHGAGDLDSGAWFGLVDNVVMIPEPVTISLVGLVGMFVAGRRWPR